MNQNEPFDPIALLAGEPVLWKWNCLPSAVGIAHQDGPADQPARDVACAYLVRAMYGGQIVRASRFDREGRAEVATFNRLPGGTLIDMSTWQAVTRDDFAPGDLLSEPVALPRTEPEVTPALRAFVARVARYPQGFRDAAGAHADALAADAADSDEA